MSNRLPWGISNGGQQFCHNRRDSLEIVPPGMATILTAGGMKYLVGSGPGRAVWEATDFSPALDLPDFRITTGFLGVTRCSASKKSSAIFNPFKVKSHGPDRIVFCQKFHEI